MVMVPLQPAMGMGYGMPGGGIQTYDQQLAVVDNGHSAGSSGILSRFFHHGSDNHHAYNQVYNQQHHKAKLSHELVAAAVAFAAMHQYEKHEKAQGHHVSHPHAKEFIAAIIGFELDKLIETKGLDYVDKKKIQHHATQQAHHSYDNHHGYRY